jgi:hypothetical protein
LILQSLVAAANTTTLSEKHELEVSENRVLVKIFGPKREDVIGWWKKEIA